VFAFKDTRIAHFVVHICQFCLHIVCAFSKEKKGNDLVAHVIATLQDCWQGPGSMVGITSVGNSDRAREGRVSRQLQI
jgi:hypothetical protein